MADEAVAAAEKAVRHETFEDAALNEKRGTVETKENTA